MPDEEEFLIRTIGGPFADETRVVPRGVLGRWPPPVNLPGSFHGGTYVLTAWSQLPDGVSHKHLLRGAEYEWRPGLGTP